MNKAPLDRLSALLAGLAPRVQVALPPVSDAPLALAASDEAFLHVHLLAAGRMRLRDAQGQTLDLLAPCIAVCPSRLAHELVVAGDAPASLICARASLDGPVAPLLYAEFAAVQVVSLAGADASLRHVIELIAAELHAPRCGQPALLDRAGDILFIGLLRHLIARPRADGGLLSGLANPRIARALVAMHERPQAAWTLESLAAEAGMSRTAFARSFHTVMQQTPGKYLAAIRLAIARRVVDQGQGLKAAAQAAGYGNASALSRALSRTSPSR